jgi:hypothetical protein
MYERVTDGVRSNTESFRARRARREARPGRAYAGRARRAGDVDHVHGHPDADPAELAQKDWVEFDGIVPHKPAYNTYRVEFRKLIARLNETADRPEAFIEDAK